MNTLARDKHGKGAAGEKIAVERQRNITIFSEVAPEPCGVLTNEQTLCIYLQDRHTGGRDNGTER